MKYRIIIVTTLLALALALSGCGSDGSFIFDYFNNLPGDETGSGDTSGGDGSVDSGSTGDEGATGGSDAQAVTDAIWVAEDGSDTSGTGAIANPFRTVGKAVAESLAAGGTLEVHVAAGTFDETVALGDASGYTGIAIRGGYGPLDAATGTRPRDTATYASSVTRIVVDGTSGSPLNGVDAVIEGLALSSAAVLNASAEITGNTIVAASPDCAGGAALSISSTGDTIAMPIVSSNRIENADCPYSDTADALIALEILSQDTSELTPEVSANEIVAGSATTAADYALGLKARAAGASLLWPALSGNTIRAGAAALYSTGVNMFGDGVTALALLDVLASDIRSGTAPLSYGLDLGYDGVGDRFATLASATLSGNTISGGSDSDWSVGISIVEASDVSIIENNFVSGGVSATGVSTSEAISLDGADAEIVSNTLVALGGATSVMLDLLATSGLTRIENNIFYGTGLTVIGVIEPWDSEPASLQWNLFDDAVGLVYFSNLWGDLATVADLEMAYPSFTHNLSGLASLIDPENLDLHIDEFSDALDAGSSASAPAEDIDGDARPIYSNFDIGADEYSGVKRR
jgi:hypothetical protein